jgi:hypothetical protein
VAPVVRVGSWPLNAFRQRESAQPLDKRTSAAGFTVDGLWSVAGEGPSAQNGAGRTALGSSTPGRRPGPECPLEELLAPIRTNGAP